MMGAKELGGVSVAGAALLYAGVIYFAVAPEVGHRYAMAHELKPCKANYVAWVEEQFAAKLAKVAPPNNGVEMRMIQGARNSPMFKLSQQLSRYGLRRGQPNPMERIFGPMMNPGNVMGAAAAAARSKYEASQRAFRAAKHNIQKWMKDRRAKADAICEESILRTVSETQTDWAIFSGSLTFIRPPGVKNIRANIKRNLIRVREDA